MSETLIGIKTKELWRNEKTGACGFFLQNNGTNIYCVGKAIAFPIFSPIKINGYFKETEKGKTFCIQDIENDTSTKESLVLFLKNLNIDSLDDATANDFIDFFGNIIDVVKNETIEGFKQRCNVNDNLKANAKKVYKKINGIVKQQEIYFYILSHGGTTLDVKHLQVRYGDKALEIIKKIPFTVGYYSYMEYEVIDAIATEIGLSYLSEERVEGIANYAMRHINEQGHTYVTKEDFEKEAKKLINSSKLEKVSVEYVLAKALLNQKIIVDKEKVLYSEKNYRLENSLAHHIVRLIKSKQKLYYNEKVIEELIDNAGIQLSLSQKDAFKALENTGVKIITGGPGTGKTTIVNLLIKYIEEVDPLAHITLCAPTGCAAQNLANKTNHIAETIHRTLAITPWDKDELRTTKTMEDKYYIIDEGSMLDLELAEIFFSAIPSGSLVLIIGDIDQLPSVGAGNVLNDLIQAKIPVFRLNECFRQDNDSCIIENANRVNHKDTRLIENDEFVILNASSEEDAIELASWSIAEGGVLLTPLRKTQCGSVQLSNKIQELIGRQGNGKLYGKTTFYCKDKVIAIENNYQLGYFNGEHGVVTDVSNDGIVIQFENKNIFVPNSYLGQIALSYAITIHKSQGAEFDKVVILLTKKSAKMLQKNLLYTAITRAKKEVVIIAEEGCLEKAITTDNKIRNTGLTEKILEKIKII